METSDTILVVDDHQDLLDNIGMALEAAGFQVETASNGLEAIDHLENRPVSLILADIAMPGMNGYQLYEKVRANPDWVHIPFLFLSARALDSDVRYGKELGADDYLTKPIQPEDLLAAVRGRLRRAQQLASATSPNQTDNGNQPLIVGTLHIDPRQHQAWMGEEKLSLSAREFTLLETLARNAGNVLTTEALVVATHELETDAIEAGSLLRPLIRSLRRKLGYSVGQLGCIENIRGVGYRLVAPQDE